MTLTQEIKNNPYLKVINCLDKSDCDLGMNLCLELEKRYGKSRMLDSIFNNLFEKKEKLTK